MFLVTCYYWDPHQKLLQVKLIIKQISDLIGSGKLKLVSRSRSAPVCKIPPRDYYQILNHDNYTLSSWNESGKFNYFESSNRCALLPLVTSIRHKIILTFVEVNLSPVYHSQSNYHDGKFKPSFFSFYYFIAKKCFVHISNIRCTNFHY